MRVRDALAVASVLVVVPLARAAHPLVTEDTGTQGRDRWQLEINGERNAGDGSAYSRRAAATLSYGAIDTVDLQVTLLHAAVEHGVREAGWADAAFDLKWRFLEHGALSLGLKPGFTVPSGSTAFSTHRTTWGSLLIASFEQPAWALHSHIGYRRNRNSSEERTSLRHLSAALWLKPTGQLRLILDRSRETDPDPGASVDLRDTVVGAIYSITRDVDLDIGMRRTHGAAGARFLLAGATLRW